jgi:hypothetical protein
MIIKEGKISMDPGKLQGISKWPSPTTVKQVWGFLGFGNFYRRFIRHFSEIAKQLNDLLKKDHKFEWMTDCQNSFNELEKCFTKEHVLAMPVPTTRWWAFTLTTPHITHIRVKASRRNRASSPSVHYFYFIYNLYLLYIIVYLK